MNTPMRAQLVLPYKSVAAALLFSVVLGPVGLLYATFWGGMLMTLGSLFVICNKFYFVALLIWITCCIWSVGSVNLYNQKIMKHYLAVYSS